jgi:hypothetical protein
MCCFHIGRGHTCLFLAALCLSSGFAQTNGRICGHVVDSSQSTIPAAAVTAENPTTGRQRRAVTDQDGYYSISDVSIGAYRVKAEKDGFQTGVTSEIVVGVAESARVDFTLWPGSHSEVVEVRERAAADAPNGAGFRNNELLDLPINGRDYARFSLLAPGAVARSNLITDLSFNGLHTVHNQYAIDGIDASRVDQPYMANGLERGARLLTGSLDTIQEFKVQTSNYQAQYGRAAGAYVNIASKSGGNQLHGAVFEYFRNDVLDARNFFNVRPAAQAKYRFNDFGANLGGPIQKNKTFYFANYEGSRQRIGATGTGTTPSALLRAEALGISPVLAPILSQFPVGNSPTANPLVDNFTTVGVSNIREDTASVRIDHNLSDHNAAFMRVNMNDSHVLGPLFAINASALGVSDVQNVPVRTSNVAVRDQHLFSARFLNEFVGGMQRWASQIIADTPYPLIAVSQFTISPGSRGRNRDSNTSYQIGDDMSYVRGTHTLKWGAAAYRIQVDYRTSNLSGLTYTSLQDLIANRAARGTFTVGNPGSATRAFQAGAYIQDAWQARRGLTVDYGLRYDFETPPYDPSDRTQTFDTRTAALAPPGGDYFRPNTRDFGPRIALAWQATKRLIARGGYGIFWQAYPVGFGAYSLPLNNIHGNTTLLQQQVPALGYPLDPFLSEGSHPLPTVSGFDSIKRDVYAQQWNVATTYTITDSAVLNLAYLGNHGLNLRRNLNINFFDPKLGSRPNPAFADINIEGNTGQNVYEALQVSLRHRLHYGVHLDLNYTWAHAIDDVQDAGLFSAQPQDNSNFKAERGNSSGDIRHSLSYDLIWQLPIGKGQRFLGHASGLADKVFGGWQIASLGLVHTGVANTVYIGTNTFGNGNLANQRPNAVVGVDLYARERTVDQWFNASAFSLPAAATFGNLGRNTIFGPGLVQIDFAVLKETPIAESARIQFRAEAYNLVNHPNFAQPNTVFGTPNFGRIFNTLGRTLGMGTSRQIQLALRLTF